MKKYLLFFLIVIMGTMIAGQSNAQSEPTLYGPPLPDKSPVPSKPNVQDSSSWGNPATDPWNQPGIIQNKNDVTESYSYKSYGSGSDVIVVTKYWIHESDTINIEKRVLRMDEVFRTYVNDSERYKAPSSWKNTNWPIKIKPERITKGPSKK
ncbi:MAG TPA: hypothetical protein PK950_02980, partial [Candidatus Paceibacterota bacterium]|nr:hypothetical protein [Candidatus Paceibacterota bacterium]